MKRFLILCCSLVATAVVADAETYAPKIVPSDFTSNITHPYFTLRPGTTYTYRASDGSEVNKVFVTDKTRKVMGVTTRVVWDRVWREGKLIEETYDWYAQDRAGNVWYFGEDSKEIEHGKIARTGSWEAGVQGAQPGIVMPAHPRPGKPYRQEYRKGEAEDMAQIVSLREKVEVPAGSYKNCLKTKDWSPLEANSVEHKLYARETGCVVLELEHGGRKRVELVSITGRR